MGHVQLKVTDAGLTETEAFYCDRLGFDVQGRLGGMFLAVGVTEHRADLVFTNRFGPGKARDDTARLLSVDLRLPDLEGLAEGLKGYPHEYAGDTLLVRDPSGNLLRFAR